MKRMPLTAAAAVTLGAIGLFSTSATPVIASEARQVVNVRAMTVTNLSAWKKKKRTDEKAQSSTREPDKDRERADAETTKPDSVILSRLPSVP
jgi:hypothetical protein